MVKRTKKGVAGETDKLNEHDAAAILTYITDALSSGKSQSKDNLLTDDVIVSLADAYENKRARQVTEWELGQHVSRAV